MPVPTDVQKVVIKTKGSLVTNEEGLIDARFPQPQGDVYVVHVFQNLQIQQSLEITDKPSSQNISLIAARDMPSEFTMTVVCASELTVPAATVVGANRVFLQDADLKTQVQRIRGLYRQNVTIETRTFDAVGVVRQVTVRDDAEFDNVVYVDLEVRTVPHQIVGTGGPRLGRIEIPAIQDPAGSGTDNPPTGSGPHTCLRLVSRAAILGDSDFETLRVAAEASLTPVKNIGRNIGNIGKWIGKQGSKFGRGAEVLWADIRGKPPNEDSQSDTLIDLEALLLAGGFRDENEFYLKFFEWAITEGNIPGTDIPGGDVLGASTITRSNVPSDNTTRIEMAKALLRIFEAEEVITQGDREISVRRKTYISTQTRGRLSINKQHFRAAGSGNLLIEFSKAFGLELRIYGVCEK